MSNDNMFQLKHWTNAKEVEYIEVIYSKYHKVLINANDISHILLNPNYKYASGICGLSILIYDKQNNVITTIGRDPSCYPSEESTSKLLLDIYNALVRIVTNDFTEEVIHQVEND